MRTDGNAGGRRASRAPARGATYITDLTHFLDENGLPPVDAPRRLLKLLAFLGSILKAGSSHPTGAQFSSAVPCRRRFCSRLSLTIANGRDGTIRWECPDCGENGYISKWQGSYCDLSAAMEPDAGLRVEIFVTAEEHKWLSEIMTSNQEEDAIIAGGVVGPAGIWISGRPRTSTCCSDPSRLMPTTPGAPSDGGRCTRSTTELTGWSRRPLRDEPRDWRVHCVFCDRRSIRLSLVSRSARSRSRIFHAPASNSAPPSTA